MKINFTLPRFSPGQMIPEKQATARVINCTHHIFHELQSMLATFQTQRDQVQKQETTEHRVLWVRTIWLLFGKTSYLCVLTNSKESRKSGRCDSSVYISHTLTPFHPHTHTKTQEHKNTPHQKNEVPAPPMKALLLQRWHWPTKRSHWLGGGYDGPLWQGAKKKQADCFNMLVMDEEHTFRIAFWAWALNEVRVRLCMKMKSLIRQSHRRCPGATQLGVTPTVITQESALGSQKSQQGPASQPHNSTQKQRKKREREREIMQGKTNKAQPQTWWKLINNDRTGEPLRDLNNNSKHLHFFKKQA